jgi:hypothetical protein
MIVLKIIGAILYAVLKVAVVFLQIALTILAAFVSFGGGVVKKIGGIIGGLFIMASLMCLATGQVSGHEFWMMFLVGIAFGAIPAAIKMLGEEGIFAVKNALSKI